MLAVKREGGETPPTQTEGADRSSPKRPRTGVKLLKGLCLSVVSTVIALGMVEGIFRLSVSSVEKPPVSDVPRYDYLPENSYRARDYYYGPQKAPGVFRIVVIGDSFTFGGKMHFDDSFAKRLERMLNLNTKQRKVEVLNWGISGYSTLHEVELVKDAVSQFNPDLIVVQITLNDAEVQPFRVTHKYQNKRGKVILSNPIFKYWTSLGYLVKRIYYTTLNREYVTYHAAAFENPASWNVFSGAFQQIRQQTSSRSIPLLAVLFPMMSHPFDDRYPFHAVHKKIGDEMAAQGISFVDLFADFEGRDPVRLQVEPGSDAHPNEIAHRLAADRIYTTLLNLKLLPKDVEIKRYSKRMQIRPHAIRPEDRSPASTR